MQSNNYCILSLKNKYITFRKICFYMHPYLYFAIRDLFNCVKEKRKKNIDPSAFIPLPQSNCLNIGLLLFKHVHITAIYY